MIDKYSIIVDIENCARCNDDHKDLLFQSFIQNIVVGDDLYTHWCMCPDVNEPIILTVINQDIENS